MSVNKLSPTILRAADAQRVRVFEVEIEYVLVQPDGAMSHPAQESLSGVSPDKLRPAPKEHVRPTSLTDD